MTKRERSIRKMVKNAGGRINKIAVKSGHYKVWVSFKKEKPRLIVFSQTASDYRADKNSRSLLRRLREEAGARL